MCEEIIDNNVYESVPVSWLENDSYTISYNLSSPEEEGWISFHDYIPDYSICLRNQTLLQFYNNSLYQMNIGGRGVYFGLRYESSITPVIVSGFRAAEGVYPFIVKSINWNADIERLEIRDLLKTWSSISLHNSFQGTRTIDLKVFDKKCSLLEQYGTFNVKRVSNRWYFNYAFNEKYSGNERTYKELVDKFLVINTIDKSCSMEDQRARMKDDFVIVKLTFNNLDNNKMIHYELNMDLLVTTQ